MSNPTLSDEYLMVDGISTIERPDSSSPTAVGTRAASREPARATSPYPGLRPFHDGEAEIFFGRETQTDDLLERLQRSHFIAVVGQSGCGKSSLVRAGVIAALESGFLSTAGAVWRIATMRPGEQPIARLVDALLSPTAIGPEGGADASEAAIAQAMLRRGPLGLTEIVREAALPPNENLLVLVDQFEEIFRFREQGKADDADAFVGLLLAAAAQRDVPIYVLITMRSDFLGDCALFTGLPEAINGGQYLTPRLTREQIRAAIVGPARVFGGDIEAALVNRLLNEIGPDPDQLPLLQHALMRMWAHVTVRNAANGVRSGRVDGAPIALVTMADYEAVGAFDKALSTHADQVLGSLTARQQEIVRVMLCRLTARGSGNRDVRHPARVDDIAAVAGASTQEVIEIAEAFRQERRSFLTPPPPLPITADTTLDIGHESLIRNWRQLSGWVVAEDDSADQYRRLAQSAELFDKRARGLLTPEEVFAAVEWRKAHRPNAAWAARYHPGFERAESFLQESIVAHDAVVRAKETRHRRKRFVRAAATIGTTVALIGSALGAAWLQDEHKHTRELTSAKLKSDSLADSARALAATLSIQKAKADTAADDARSETREVQRQRTELEAFNRVLLSNDTAAAATGQLETNPDRALTLAVAAMRIQVTPTATRVLQQAMVASRLRQEVAVGAQVWQRAGSPDGKFVVVPDSLGQLRVWDIASGQKVAGPPRIDGQYVRNFFSPRGTVLGAMATTGTVRLWDTRTWEPLGTIDSLTVPADTPTAGRPFPALSNDGKYMAGWTQNRRLLVWDAATGRQLGQVTGVAPPASIAFSPNDSAILTIAADGIATLSPRPPLNEPRTSHYGDLQHPIQRARFSPDGALLLTTGRSRPARFYLVARPDSAWDLPRSAHIRTADFSPDGESIVATSDTVTDGTTTSVWQRPFDGSNLVPLDGQVGSLRATRFSQNGRWVLTVGAGGSAKLWEARTGQTVADFPGATIAGAWLSGDARRLLTISPDGVLRRWDTMQLGSETTLHGLPRRAGKPALEYMHEFPAAFSPDHKRLLATGADGMPRIWETATGRLVASLGKAGEHRLGGGAALSPVGTRAIAPGPDSIARVWDTENGKELFAFPKARASLVATNFGDDAHPWIWDASGHIQIVSLADQKTYFTSEGAEPDCVTISPNAAWMVACGLTKDGEASEGAIRVTPLPSGASLELGAHTDRIVDVFFSKDSRFAVSASYDKTAVVWHVGSWERVSTLRDHTTPVRYAFFSPDAKLVATISEDHSLRVFERETGRLLSGVMRGHTGLVRMLAFSADNRWMVSGSDDNTARVWDTSTGAAVGVLVGQAGPVVAVSIYKDGGTVMVTAASADGTTRSYSCDVCVPTGELMRRATERVAATARSRAMVDELGTAR